MEKQKIWTPDLEKLMRGKKLAVAAWSAVALAAAYKAARAVRSYGRSEAFLYSMKLNDLAGVGDVIDNFVDEHVKK